MFLDINRSIEATYLGGRLTKQRQSKLFSALASALAFALGLPLYCTPAEVWHQKGKGPLTGDVNTGDLIE